MGMFLYKEKKSMCCFIDKVNIDFDECGSVFVLLDWFYIS